MAAAVTTTLEVATGICLVPERNAIVTAKEVATLDAFSNGRFLFGIGAGWLREESELLGVDFPRRWTQTAECIAAMRELWSKDEASFEGKYVKFTPVRCNPKPIQQPGRRCSSAASTRTRSSASRSGPTDGAPSACRMAT